MNITESTLNQFRRDYSKAIAELEKKYGVNMSIGSITYECVAGSRNIKEFRFKNTSRVNNTPEPKFSSSVITPASTTSKGVIMEGDKVKINHKTISPNDVFVVFKINRKNIKVRDMNSNRTLNVSKSLIEKI